MRHRPMNSDLRRLAARRLSTKRAFSSATAACCAMLRKMRSSRAENGPVRSAKPASSKPTDAPGTPQIGTQE